MSNAWRRPDTLPDLRNADLIALDTETDDSRLRRGLGSGWATGESRIVGISAAWREGSEIRSFYAPVAHPDSDNFPREQVFQWVRDHVAAGVRFVGQNSIYDWGGLRAEAGIKMPPGDRLEEIGAAATLLDENRFAYGLDDLCTWRNLPTGKDETLLRNTVEKTFNVKCTAKKVRPQAYIARLPAAIVGPYAEQEAVSTLLLHENLDPLLDREGLRTAYRLEVDLLPLVLEMRLRGIRVDLDAAARNRDILLRKRDAVLAEIADKLKVTGVDMEDIGHTKWLAETCDRLGITYPRTAKGNPSFTSSAAQLGWMKQHPHWFPPAVVRVKEYHNAATKFLQTYVIEHAVGERIFAEIHPHKSEEGGAKSTRMSYSDPPLQQMSSHNDEIAPFIRGVFLPDVGEAWSTCDYSQQEYRLLVGEAASRDLTGAREAALRYCNGHDVDFHALVAEIAGIDRQTAKSANFAKAYRAGVKKFAATIHKSETEAQAIMYRYDRELPFVSQLAELCHDQAERDGILRLFDGTIRHFNQWEARGIEWGKGNLAPCSLDEAQRRRRTPSHPWFNQRIQRAGAYTALNALIQGTGARIAKLWMLACWHENIVPLLQMHDALELSTPSPDVAERVAQLGRDVVKLDVPMEVGVKYGRTWADAKYSWTELPAERPPAAACEPYQPLPPRLASQGRLLREPRAEDFQRLEQFVDMVAERHAIYQRREAGQPHPWTNNPILGRWFFTNMYRSLDKNTVWLWEHWCQPHVDDPDLWFAMVVARLTNRIETWEALGYPVPWNPEHFITVMSSRPKGKAYGSAYVIPGITGDKRPKYATQAEILTQMWNDREKLRPC
jgi:DNA polymerase I-like protein with 3'-5' exonuclease and polymerase domains